MYLKQVLSAISIALTLFAFIPYIRATINKTIKPHVFSWLIWGATTFIVFLAQIQAKAGVGAWPIGVSGMLSFSVAILAYTNKADSSITRLDWMFFLIAMTALPFWYWTSNALWAVLILTLVNVLGFAPTLRKAYDYPFDEKVSTFVIFTARNIFAIMALQHYSTTTVLFPAVIALACLFLIVVIMIRRRVLCLSQ